MLTPNYTKEVKLDLLKDSSVTEAHKEKPRGQVVLELTYAPFREQSDFSGQLNGSARKDSTFDRGTSNISQTGAGMLLVNVQGASDVEGSRHNNPYVLIIFRGERKKSKVIIHEQFPFCVVIPLFPF